VELYLSTPIHFHGVVLDSTGYVFRAWYFVKHRDKFICVNFTTTKIFNLQLASFNLYMFL